jgi:g-D-glutamyl-meso-diaminopimelate peptidase
LRKVKLWFIILLFLFSGLSIPGNVMASSLIVNPKQVYSYSKMISDIRKLKSTYPGIVNVKIIGKSEYGRNIYAVSLGKGPAKTFINGAHHAREWLTTTLNMYMINQYAEAYKKNQKINGYDARKILNSTTIWFVPMVNPDGVTLQQKGPGAFPKSVRKSLIKMNNGSKNFKRWKANGKGIDLNRQYNAGWKNIKGPKKPSYKNYKGKKPEQAKETKAILKFVSKVNPEMAVSYHSSGKILYWNYKQSKSSYKRDYVYAKKVKKMTGYKLIYTGKHPTGGGGFTDWFISVKKKPALTPEIAKSVYETNPSVKQFPSVWKENKAVGLYIAAESSKLFNSRVNSQIKSLQVNAKKLQNYYLSNLKMDKGYTDLYNSVKKNTDVLTALSPKLTPTYRTKLESSLKKVKFHLTNSANYLNGINTGKSLLNIQNSLKMSFVNGTLDSNTVLLQQKLTQMLPTTSSAIGKMYGSSVKGFATNKYIVPANFTLEDTKYKISRYKLSLQIENLIKSGDILLANEQLVHLETLEKQEQNRSVLYPGKYSPFPKAEQLLIEKKVAIKEQLKEVQK